MAEPTTAWGREAVSDIADLKRSATDIERRLTTIEGKVDGLHSDFVEFRAEIRALSGVAKLAITTFGLAAIGAALGVAFSVAKLGGQVDNLSTRIGVIETRFERIAPPTVAPPQGGSTEPRAATDTPVRE